MALVKQPLEIDSSDDEVIEGTITIPAGRPAFTGSESLYFVVKNNATDTDAAAVLSRATGGQGITITDIPAKTFAIDLPRATTAALVSGTKAKYVYDVKMLDTAGKVSRVATGDLTVFQSIRRAV